MEFATNWPRVFVDQYQRIKWLNAFAVINEIALQKSLINFSTVFFEIDDNVIDKQLLQSIQNLDFIKRHDLKFII